MGLDMHLNKKRYIWGKEKEALKIEGIPEVNLDKVTYIEEQVAYWRKSNQIHQWFVENVQDGVDDCNPHWVAKGNIVILLDLITQVLEKHTKEAAEELLPTQGGFFFGSLEYDEYYWRDLEDTKRILTEILANWDDRCEYYYQSSW